MKLTSRIIQCVIVSAALLSTFGLQAQTFPNKPIRIVVPFAPGGNVDVTARVISAAMTKQLNQTVFVENKTGAGGKIGAESAIRSPADGYTLLMGSNSSLSVAPNLYSNWPYDPLTGLAPITHLASVPFVLITRPGLGVKSMADLVRMAKQKPGSLTMASAGSGTSNQLVGEFFQSVTGTSFLHVPYKGGGPATTAVVSGEAQLIAGTPAALSTQLQSNRLRLLAVTSDTRLKAFPDAPTVSESGVPGYEYRGWVAVLGPAGLPRPIVDRLNAEIKKVLDRPDNKLGELEPWHMTPEQAQARIRADYEKHGKLVKAIGGIPN